MRSTPCISLCLLALLWLANSPAKVAACAVCATGDPTLTTMGIQQPVGGRIRLSLELQQRTDAVGRAGAGRVELSEQRAILSAAYAPTARFMASLSVPMLRRVITHENLAQDTVLGLGDLELRGKAFVFRDRAFAPRHLLAAVGGVSLPTGAVDTQLTERDVDVDPELQAGTGSFTPLLGVAYAFFGDAFSIFASEIVYVPLPGRAPFTVGPSLRGTHTAQYQLLDFLALRLSANFRLEAATRLSDPPRDEPDSGGLVGFLAPGLLMSPWVDLVLYAEAQLPVLNRLKGRHDEGPLLWVGAAYDL